MTTCQRPTVHDGTEALRHAEHDHLAVQAVPGTRMVVYRPADEVTREAIARLLAGEGTAARFPCWEVHERRKASLVS